mgnify:FL=1
MNAEKEIISFLERIAIALENIANKNRVKKISISDESCYLWSTERMNLLPIKNINNIGINLLHAIDNVKEVLIQNTRNFAKGLPANNVLLWGARGMGKSSIIKAIHSDLYDKNAGKRLILIEVYREDINTLPLLLTKLNNFKHRFIIFCDDLSFDLHETNYKSLKALLEGGLIARPNNVIFYATSNRRHLLERLMTENEESTAINPSESAEEKVSLSDRFGLWLGFHNCTQKEYIHMVNSYAKEYKLKISEKKLYKLAIEWSVTRGSRSGRVAWQFIVDMAGKLGQNIN